MKKQCNCAVCKQGYKFKKIINILPEKDKQWMEELYDNFICIAEDLEYYKLIFNGDWVTAEEQLERALAIVRSKKEALIKAKGYSFKWVCRNCKKSFTTSTINRYSNREVKDLIGIWANECTACKTTTMFEFDGKKFKLCKNIYSKKLRQKDMVK